MKNVIVWVFVLTAFAAVSGAANLEVICGAAGGTQSGGTLSCSDRNFTAQASSFSVSSNADETRLADAYAMGLVQVLITGGTGAGVFEPCVSNAGSGPGIGQSDLYMAGQMAQNGPAGGWQPGPCALPEYQNSSIGIPFVYGVPEVLSYSLAADATGYISWNGEVSVNLNPDGSTPTDGSAIFLTAQFTDVTPTPEPSSLALCGAALLLAAALRKRYQ